MSRKTQENFNQSSSGNARDAGSAGARRSKQKTVPDDWEEAEDSDDDDDDSEIANERLWQKANTSAPMPAVVISGSSTTSSVVSPPLEALQAPLRILKRPSQGGHASAQGQGLTAAQKSIVDREAEYQAARARIFAGKSQAGGGTAAGATNTTLRSPTGPTATATATGEGSHGFIARQQQSGKQRTPGSSSSNTQTTSNSSTSTG